MAKYLIIGGVAGGATTAARLRRMDEKAEITLYERGDYISYANCGIPYYIGGIIKDRQNIFVQTPESFNKRFNINILTRHEVEKINPADKSIEVKDLKTCSIRKETYDKLVLSPGAEPLRPPIPGINEPEIFTLRNVGDMDKIKGFINEQSPKRAVIVGAGFIGLEMAENLHKLGIKVTIVEMAEQVMVAIDYEMAAEVHQHLKTKNVEFYLKDGVSAFERKNNRLTVKLKSGKEIPADMVLLSIGVRPETKLAKEAGLKIGTKGGIWVNQYMQTSEPDIYALGDAIEYENPIIHRPMVTPLAGPANKQGRIVADNIVEGNQKTYKGTIATAIARVFDLTVASTGVSEKLLEAEKIPHIASITHGVSHAGYYPDALPMTLKIMFSPEDGKLFGAQIIGYNGTAKRIDVISSILKQGGTIYDLQDFEQAYAPPYSSAKDPVNIAGFNAENIIKGKVKIVHWHDVAGYNPDHEYLLDVRTPEEYALGAIEGAVNIPVDELRDRLAELPQDKKIIIYCAVGLRGYLASRILTQNGFTNVVNLSGGYKTYKTVMQKQSNEDIFQDMEIKKDDSFIQKDTPMQNEAKRVLEVDACGLQCPGPIMRLKKEMDTLHPGDRIQISASDQGFKRDVQSWCNLSGNLLINLEESAGKINALVEKGMPQVTGLANITENAARNKTMVVFSDDLDRALASFVIANGAASTGKKVTMFFTFWGLNVIKKKKPQPVAKDFMGKMFTLMMPRGTNELKLSKMNMLGMGTLMMRWRMKAKKVETLDELIKSAIENGVEFIGCQMSMDVMGVTKEELLDNVRVGGVASYIEQAEQSNINLFI
jgi:NADPH-dependent 2,4-dienoyl-CoA reductase/sulfur reductase-like enzyme/peroxiredoxin family protein/rhodanese-related sulfurtransferase/TusA-related sulfurtransferase